MVTESAQHMFTQLIDRCVEFKASDLHVSAGMHAFARVDGQLRSITEEVINDETMTAIAASLMHEKQRQVFEDEQSLDLAYTASCGTPFRVNVFRERGKPALALRKLEQEFRTMEELHLPLQMKEFAEMPHGLVLVTGPTGSGKSTTLATLIHLINCNRNYHIITIEDPVEYMHHNICSMVRQRELYTHVPTFADGIRDALREDPDVILVGEMRDLETMRAAITASETGHLVFSTLHSGDAVGAIDRMTAMFPAEEQQSIRMQISTVLKGVIAQKLVPLASGRGRVPVVEIIRSNNAVSNSIRRGEPQNIYTCIDAGAEDGMVSWDMSLATLVSKRLVRKDDAILLCRNESVFESRLEMIGMQPEEEPVEAVLAGPEIAEASPVKGRWSLRRRHND